MLLIRFNKTHKDIWSPEHVEKIQAELQEDAAEYINVWGNKPVIFRYYVGEKSLNDVNIDDINFIEFDNTELQVIEQKFPHLVSAKNARIQRLYGDLAKSVFFNCFIAS
jgi:hypothetical protein